MFVVINELTVAAENRAMFEQNFGASMHGTLHDVPGLRRAQLLRPNEEDRGYLSVLEFDDEPAHTAYRSSEAFRAAHNWPDHAPIDANRLTTYHAATTLRPRSTSAGKRHELLQDADEPGRKKAAAAGSARKK